jgi:hypothetical protein
MYATGRQHEGKCDKAEVKYGSARIGGGGGLKPRDYALTPRELAMQNSFVGEMNRAQPRIVEMPGLR